MLQIEAIRGDMVTYGETIKILERTTRLRYLYVQGLGGGDQNSAYPYTEIFDLPYLRTLTSFDSAPAFVAALLRGAPSLVALEYCPSGASSELLLILDQSHPRVKSLDYLVYRGKPGTAIMAGWTRAAETRHLTLLSTFMSSFPSLTYLELSETSTS